MRWIRQEARTWVQLWRESDRVERVEMVLLGVLLVTAVELAVMVLLVVVGLGSIMVCSSTSWCG